MKTVRKYGYAPFTVAVVHGGPGAAGEMAPVAQELSRFHGTLEPLQTKATIDGQVKELAHVIEHHGAVPLSLIGHSWGAWLAVLYTARYPSSVKKLILVGSGPFEERFVAQITATRMSRMNGKEEQALETLIKTLNDPWGRQKDAAFTQVGELLLKTDSYNLLPRAEPHGSASYTVFEQVWKEAEEMRRSGALLDMARQLTCPVVAIHGEYDPHPYEGVQQPLSRTIKNFTFILLKKCGHYPWLERDARKEFYQALEKELTM